jgi:hypothetical protein
MADVDASWTHNVCLREPPCTGGAQGGFGLRLGRPVSVVVTETALLIIAFGLFFLSPVVKASDSQYSMLLSENILRYGDTHLERWKFGGPVAARDFPTIPGPEYVQTYPIGWVGRHIVYLYPNGSSILSLPFVALANWLGCHTVIRTVNTTTTVSS